MILHLDASSLKIDNRKHNKKEVVEKTLLNPPPPFPQRLKKKG